MESIEFGQKIEKVPRPPTGRYVELGTFLARRIDNPYFFNPIRIREAIDFLHDPSTPIDRSRREITDSSQLTMFNQLDLERESHIDLPEDFYKWLSSDRSLTPSNISQRILERMGPVGLNYAIPARKYLELATALGEEVDFSQKSYGVDILPLQYEYRVQGRGRRMTIDVAGKFDEIRRQRTADTILRIRQKKKRPGIGDAIRLAFDQISYQAERGFRTGVKPPKMIVLNLTDGKIYNFEVLFESFYPNAVNAVILSHLARLAGYTGEPLNPSEATDISERTEERVVSFWSKPVSKTSKPIKFPASEVYEKAKKCEQILLEKQGFKGPYASFIPINPEDLF